ncbi:MAG: hypothetical protein Kow0058_17740 [Roseovarius sp.]
MRKYRIAALREDGSVRDCDQIGPATPFFEAAFSAFAHGTPIATTRGQIPVEDLVPGMKLITENRGPQQLLWIGAMTLMPRSDLFPEAPSLTRIIADSFGLGRPQTDILAGPGARLLRRPADMPQQAAGGRILTPAARLVDGVTAVEISPPSPVTVYHLCLRRHAIITAAGMAAESYHPGPGFEHRMGPNMLGLFLSFFPHVRRPADFGPLSCERLPLDAAERPAELA